MVEPLASPQVQPTSMPLASRRGWMPTACRPSSTRTLPSEPATQARYCETSMRYGHWLPRLMKSSSRPQEYRKLMKENSLHGLRSVTRSLRKEIWLVAQGSSRPCCQTTASARSISSEFSASSGASSSSATASPRLDGPAPMASSSTSRWLMGSLTTCGRCANMLSEQENSLPGTALEWLNKRFVAQLDQPGRLVQRALACGPIGGHRQHVGMPGLVCLRRQPELGSGRCQSTCLPQAGHLGRLRNDDLDHPA